MRRLALVALVAALAAGCGGSKSAVTTVVSTGTRTTAPPATARVYFLRDGKVAPVAREVPAASRAELLAALYAGPTTRERRAGFTTALPARPGAAVASRAGRAQVVYTLSQFAPAEPVDGGSRDEYEDRTPAILVESPLPFESVDSPLRVTGTANTFEATFEYELREQGGAVLAHDVVTATSGSGTRGTFAFTARFLGVSRPASLVLFERSAADGSRIHQVEIPLNLVG